MIATSSGFVSGRRGKDSRVEAFLGIPFGADTSGPGRFHPPAGPPAWPGVRACLEFGPACPQPRAILWPLTAPQSEDCLNLNVWMPRERPDGPVPVMVWFHGGGFSTGAGGSLLYDGEALSAKGVVVVTFNYRLGPFGFLGHPELSSGAPDGTSGNYGLRDQILALEWVRENVEAFGGDPGCVTIFGESAGAASVLRLAVAPAARGLFHRVIAQSGNVRGPNRRLRDKVRGLESMEAVGVEVARALGCVVPGRAASCLKDAAADDLIAAAQPSQGLFSGGTRFGPVVDGVLLPDDPETLFEAGGAAPVPYLIGTNRDEGSIFVSETDVRTRADYERFARETFGELASDILEVFPAGSDDNVNAVMNRVVTRNWFDAPARAVVRALAAAGRSVRLYRFARESPAARKKGLGAFHASEVSYIFNRVTNALAYDERDRRLAALMSAAWVRFARTGDPNGDELPEWSEYDARSEPFLNFDDPVAHSVGYGGEECDLFDRAHAMLR